MSHLHLLDCPYPAADRVHEEDARSIGVVILSGLEAFTAVTHGSEAGMQELGYFESKSVTSASGITAGKIPIDTPEPHLRPRFTIAQELGLKVANGTLKMAREIFRYDSTARMIQHQG
jgi:hypothetical protein